MAAVAAAWLALGGAAADAHFLELIPSTEIVPVEGDRAVTLDLTFTHPMEGGPAMNLVPPVRFGVLSGDTHGDLRGALTARDADGKTAYTATHRFAAPGAYVFYVEPAPYWEEAEKVHIVHYTKTVVDVGGGEDWDALVGFPVEIRPLSRPYGLWTGNLFRGLALKDGQPLPFADVEIEWKNDGSVTAPSDPFITQVVRTGPDGVFAYAMPRAGWWGFNVLAEADRPLPGPDGTPAAVEMGGTIWVKAVDMK
ncbi:DUF4198 domain-containing protein [Azospirillum halopraeferens]|uniref:DUF4198 domain-containing protein n=1 Tax=Azospirillum halopraeferens TaxID=34010 RepID=UPI0004111C9F|nr:DUF4198 domain-containing protein [Azospirillum halopraeferens]